MHWDNSWLRSFQVSIENRPLSSGRYRVAHSEPETGTATLRV
jgi:hypothetical protein